MPPKVQTSASDKIPEIKTNHFSFWDYVPIVGTIRAHKALERDMDQTLQEMKKDRQQVEKNIEQIRQDIKESREDAQKFRGEMAAGEQKIAAIRTNGMKMGK